MSLRIAVAAPFLAAGSRSMSESSFVVDLSLDRDWFSPDQAKRLTDVATGEGLLDREDDQLRPTFDPETVAVPDGFRPDESVLQQRSVFETVLDRCLEDGIEKQRAVAGINELQAELAVTVEAAAVLFAHERGIEVQPEAETALEEL
ncbi:DUF2240 domain-containing protein [Halobacteriales archaeon SW_8_65_20]|nr:MAG: DUF2240 domain-containing protein [Halobacteriales archaeon QH_7_65_31]PSQ51761.1 MAG: DUF2240 domain-containing protein [Halobacteriales archaeon SW_8_65_20]